MEAAGVALAVPGLFSVCMDIVERYQAYKDFGIEARSAVSRFEADKIRLKRWAEDVGIQDGNFSDCHDPRLDREDIQKAIKGILKTSCEIFAVTERTASQLHVPSECADSPSPSVTDTVDYRKRKIEALPSTSISASIKAGLGWTLRRRSRFLNQVDMFSKVVDSLYSLMPPSQIPKLAGAEGKIGESVLAS